MRARRIAPANARHAYIQKVPATRNKNSVCFL
jgi:hypothetical protein